MPDPDAFTRLLTDQAVPADDRARQLLPLVYDQLRAVAQQRMASERRGHTLTATALVHEAFLKLAGDRQVPWANRAHFYAAAAEAMRRILLDHAKARGRLKRGGPDGVHSAVPHPMSVVDLAADAPPEQIVALDDALRRLEAEHPDAAAVVRLRFYAGLGGDEAAAALGISPRQVDRLWSFARAWLFRTVEQDLNGQEPDRERQANPGDRE